MQDREGGAFNTFAPDDRIPCIRIYIIRRFRFSRFVFHFVIYIYMYSKRYREKRIKIRINSTVVISKITIRLPASEISSRKR